MYNYQNDRSIYCVTKWKFAEHEMCSSFDEFVGWMRNFAFSEQTNLDLNFNFLTQQLIFYSADVSVSDHLS